MKKQNHSFKKYFKKLGENVLTNFSHQIAKKVAKALTYLLVSVTLAVIPVSANIGESDNVPAGSHGVICNYYSNITNEPIPNIDKHRVDLSKSSRMNLDRFYQTGNVRYLEELISENTENYEIVIILKLMEGKYYFNRDNFEKAMLIFKSAHHLKPKWIFLILNHLVAARAYQKELILQSQDSYELPEDQLYKIRSIQKDIDNLKLDINKYKLSSK